jgi:hypothetical protein
MAEQQSIRWVQPTKDSLIAELRYRISCAENTRDELQKTEESDEAKFLGKLIDYELAFLYDTYLLARFFERKEQNKVVNTEGWTPLVDSTGVPLRIGDLVEIKDDIRGNRCGTLEWDELRQSYMIRSTENGQISIGSIKLTKIDKLYDYAVDTTAPECRRFIPDKKW